MKCTCKGFFQPIDCPFHGRDKDNVIKNRHNAMEKMSSVKDHLTEGSMIYGELITLDLGNQFLTQLESDITDIIIKLEEVQIKELRDRA